MKIKYCFVTGETEEIEVTGEAEEIIVESRRAEHAGNERERYHRAFSIDDMEYEDRRYFDSCDDPLLEVIRKETGEELYAAIEQLTQVQRRRLIKLALGMKVSDIAREEGAAHNSVKESINAAQKKMKKILSESRN